ncbi:DUF4328 domain-containing protein [Streptomyces pluripotens]|uniref:DUF4328 domain-containing protein n=1 Tax=Streptomyces pluripotens TaxID=1355015 RepID=A0A221P1N5_9ACTN|nr:MULTISPECIES: DUF4328 domain-containing protein [Streptomyces]ARP71936.1 hypothetical protein LK06_020495 [Streptomyces pluripotens]ASN26183.1 DUF4328 domain-containing protein [Streptomyces pluripotens]KIE26354.1 hypothetical protein LK08_14205 [Streptomyces sp. MUSC 125]MCH0556431.1 DUF4328 domain-containing protein [Streptomyces sp. MUM 16J]
MTSPMPAQPYAGTPGPVLRSPVALGRAAAVLLGVVIVTDLFAVFADQLELSVLGDIANGATGSAVFQRADRADSFYNAAGIAQILALVAAMVVYLCWLWRVRINAEVFAPGEQSMKRGWAIGAWFCPVVNLWFPRRITCDIWDASTTPANRRGHALINTWWALWLGSLFAERVSTRQYTRAQGVAELRDAARQILLCDLLDIVAAVLAVFVVLTITRMQDGKALAGPVLLPVDG